MVKEGKDDHLPTPTSSNNARSNKKGRYLLYAILVPCFVLGAFVSSRSNYPSFVEWGTKINQAVSRCHQNTDNAAGVCVQARVLYPQSSKNAEVWTEFGKLLETDAFKTLAIDKLSGLIQIPSESYDNMPPPGEDPRWETMGQVHDYLARAFPLIHKTLSLTKINTYGLLYEWTGTDSSLKPYILAAHQDVVPVNPETIGAWTYPPYSGFFDGINIWGRGATDDKASLAAIMLTLETLLEKGWTPARMVVLAFGFDEEASGLHGAGSLGKALEETYGQNAFEFIVDEGGGFDEAYGTVFAAPAVAEKGYIDVKIDVTSPGGHSSVPPPHTTIGYLSSLITEFEKNPYPIELTRGSVPHDTLLCAASYGQTIPRDLKHAILKSRHSDKAMRKVEELFVLSNIWYASLVGTTQAVDIISGGVKANALPESASAILNHRINTESSIKETTTRDGHTIADLVYSFNLTLNAFGEDLIPASAYASKAMGHVELSLAFNDEREPAPRTPTTGKHWEFLSGTIKATYNAHRGLEGEDNIIISPGMSTGNTGFTDTKYYWNLTRNIFRYNHNNGTSAGVHTVNENIALDHYLEMVRFFTTLIVNADEADF
ncbi:carboxypeptidase S [Rhodocollybia butyracea]|uniref:Carboxypeptidase S n=1 Tax=Rhodocollybia butyracea TaxID=206335 RepID=A0A9P5PWY7_9AGAR|nr:carboxypeptidase S [Rhodocollybia butyracea]